MRDPKAPAAGAVIGEGNGKYLLIQENWGDVKGLWNLPAGIQDQGEELYETAAREAHEEVGLKVKITNKSPLVVKISDRSGRSLHSFKAEVVGGELKIDPKEISQAKWLTIEEVEKIEADGKLRDIWVLKSLKKADKL
jgi:8-oxo-dGTP diphosphatase